MIRATPPHPDEEIPVTDDPQAYIDEMARSRGYVLDYHKVGRSY